VKNNKVIIGIHCDFPKLSIIAIVFFLLGVSYVNQAAFAQASNTGSNTIDWYTLLVTILGVSGLISAGASAAINHFFTKKQIKTQHDNSMKELDTQLKTQHDNTMTQLDTQLKTQHDNTMKELDTQLKTQHDNTMNQLNAGFANTVNQLKEQRQVQLIQDKLNLYSSIIYYLKKMPTSPGGKSGIPPDDRIIENINKIDSIVQTKFYLLSSITNAGANPLMEWMTLSGKFSEIYSNSSLEFEDRVTKLRIMLLDEYNNEIIPEIEQITGRPGIVKRIID